jgi:tRNA pseudouridine55 synthase
VLTKVDPPEFKKTHIEEILQRFKGKITQQIPLYSSKKIKRKPLYKWAREGAVIEPLSKEVEIFDIKLLDYAHPYVDLKVTCSKGTYIRTLAHDFGSTLGCGATLFSLKRTKHGEFTEDMGVDIGSFKISQDLLNYLISLKKILTFLKEVVVEAPLERFLKNGMPIPLLGSAKEWKNGDLAKLLNKKGELIGIGTVDIHSRTIKVKRLINN